MPDNKRFQDNKRLPDSKKLLDRKKLPDNKRFPDKKLQGRRQQDKKQQDKKLQDYRILEEPREDSPFLLLSLNPWSVSYQGDQSSPGVLRFTPRLTTN